MEVRLGFALCLSVKVFSMRVLEFSQQCNNQYDLVCINCPYKDLLHTIPSRCGTNDVEISQSHAFACNRTHDAFQYACKNIHGQEPAGLLFQRSLSLWSNLLRIFLNGDATCILMYFATYR